MRFKPSNLLLACAMMLFNLASALPAQAASARAAATDHEQQTYTSQEILAKGHQMFGRATKEVASVVEYAFQRNGEPNAYIVGEEGSGAFIGGLRYGEGTLFMKNGLRQKIYWQGPSIGMDFGGNGSRVLVLVYGLQHPNDLLTRFAGIEGTAYVVGGLGVNFQKYANVTLAPIRTGVGLRLGLNAGYLKYSDKPQWNPF